MAATTGSSPPGAGPAGLPRIIALDNTVRGYAWGSATAIPQLLGIEPSGEPVAELWMGAHPSDPSRWAGHPEAPGLDGLIAADPEGVLGAGSVQRFGPVLPFLLKVLAADRSLSLQVHPNADQARAGFAAEEGRGIARSSPERNYVDDNHKPELLCALTEVRALCGFRPVEPTLELFDELIAAGAAELASYRAVLSGEGGLRTSFTTLLSLPVAARATVLASVVPACRVVAEQGGRWAEAASASLLAAGDFPGDIGAVVALLLNTVRLQPGEAIFLAAGNVHAYLRGTGIEILASSDNVLRCGLTPKHVDVPELIRITDFQPLVHPLWPAGRPTAGVRRFEVPVQDFQLTEIGDRAEPQPLDGDTAHLVLCTAGATELAGGGERLTLARGGSAFVRAGSGSVLVSTTGQAFLGSPALR